jgi:hypothetical protein
LLPPFPEVVVYLPLVMEVVTDHCVDVCQTERRILLRDLLRCRSFAKCGDHRIQRNARASDTHDAVPVGNKRNGFGPNHQRHKALPHDPAQRSEPTQLEKIIPALAPYHRYQFNIYLMHDAMEEILDAHGEEIIPALEAKPTV